jgi:hypothetical protein
MTNAMLNKVWWVEWEGQKVLYGPSKKNGVTMQGHLVEGEDSDTFFSLLWSEIYN